jgi:4-amino-4-deoxy-L-arabinose transferase-like glycosyltransferase
MVYNRTVYDWFEFIGLSVEGIAPQIAACILGVICLVATIKSIFRPLWFDELFTTFIANQPTYSGVLACVKQVSDGQPVLYHWLVKASVGLLHSNPLGVRIPSMVGYALFCLSLYVFVSRLTSKLYGLVAMLFPCATGCWYYASEGRPYGLVLAGTGIAAVSWQSIATDRFRKLALAGLGLSLLFAFSMSYFGILLFVPFAIAESIRSLNRRKLDLSAWIAISAPVSILAFYLPIMHQTQQRSGIGVPASARPAWFGSLSEFAQTFVGPVLVPVICLSCLYAAYVYFAPSRLSRPRYSGEPKHLLAYVAITVPIVCVLPFAGIAFGKFATHQFFPRYIVSTMFGISAIAVLVLWLAFEYSRTAGLISLLLFGVVFGHRIVFDLKEAGDSRANPPETAIRRSIPAQVQSDDLPIAVADGFHFFSFRYYGDSVLRRRIYYLSSEEFAYRYLVSTYPV